MKEQGIMFSAPMVRAIAEGRKTQTRRLASSPLARLKPGTILWVRETFSFDVAYDTLKPKHAPVRAAVWFEADGRCRGGGVKGKLRPAIHMPRFAARFGLRLDEVRVEPLHEVSEGDAIAEGVENISVGPGNLWKDYLAVPNGFFDARFSYQSLWASLHGAENWAANPDVVVLSFSKAWVDQ
jgi:hypothetical protein